MTIRIDSSVIERLEAADPDRVRAARLADADMRDRLFALYAFHMELAKVPELVTDPMIGRIRYQWWRDAVEEIYGSGPVRQHEVSTPLAEMVAQTGLSRFWLDRIIDGRERDLDPRPFADVAAATDYADATSGVLAQTAAAICGAEEGVSCGRAWGLTGLARGYRYYADTMLKAIAFDNIVSAARAAYDNARQTKRGDSLPALGYTTLIPGFLKRMTREAYDPTQHVPDFPAFSKQLRLMRAVATGRV